MRTFNVSKKILPYMTGLLQEKGKTFCLLKQGTKITLDMSGNEFHKIVEISRCRYLEDRDNLSFPVLRPCLMHDSRKKREILEKYNSRSFILLA